MNKVLIVDAEKCIGCRMCEGICSLVHFGVVGEANARIKVVGYDNAAFFNPVACTQCEVPYCASVCPSQAITKNSRTGIVKITKKKCTGCKACLTACPFGAISFVDNVAIKCELCGGNPACIEFCQAEALTFGVPNELGGAKRTSFSDKMFEIYQANQKARQTAS